MTSNVIFDGANTWMCNSIRWMTIIGGALCVTSTNKMLILIVYT
jgi:hypothetical protein